LALPVDAMTKGPCPGSSRVRSETFRICNVSRNQGPDFWATGRSGAPSDDSWPCPGIR
jgi:hypothetical protein